MSGVAINPVASSPSPVISTPRIPDREVRTVLHCKNLLLRVGLKHLLKGTRFAISDAAFDKISLLECGSDPAHALIILDASHSSEQGIETVRSMKLQQPEVRVVMVADQFDLSFVQTRLEAGVDGFLLSGSAREVLITSLELIMLGETVVPTALVRSMIGEKPQHRGQDQDHSMAELESLDPKVRKLSAREAEILKCLMGGEPNKVIARKLDIAEATVKIHIKAILRKIRVANRTQAAMWATKHFPTRVGLSLNARSA